VAEVFVYLKEATHILPFTSSTKYSLSVTKKYLNLLIRSMCYDKRGMCKRSICPGTIGRSRPGVWGGSQI